MNSEFRFYVHLEQDDLWKLKPSTLDGSLGSPLAEWPTDTCFAKQQLIVVRPVSRGHHLKKLKKKHVNYHFKTYRRFMISAAKSLPQSILVHFEPEIVNDRTENFIWIRPNCWSEEVRRRFLASVAAAEQFELPRARWCSDSVSAHCQLNNH